MTEEARGGPLAVTVWALWRGAEIAGPGALALLADGVRVTVPRAGGGGAVELLMPLASLDGARVSVGHLALYPANGDVVELSGGPELEGAGRHLRERACTLPELTLALRGLGSVRGHPGSDHDRFFASLLDARRAAQRANDPSARSAAFRASVIAADLERALRAFAADRFPASAAERRALEAELDDLAAPVRASLRRLDEAARAAAAASDDTAFVWWRAWAAECRALFAHADRCWLAVGLVLSDTGARPRRFWHWLWRPAALTDGPTSTKARHG